jgi:hypothetical protein
MIYPKNIDLTKNYLEELSYTGLCLRTDFIYTNRQILTFELIFLFKLR